MEEKIRVIVFDDNSQRRDSLSILLDTFDSMTCVGCYENCANAEQVVEETKAMVVLMDINMPVVDGIEGTHRLRAKYPNLKILIQTVFEDDEKVFAAICAGADGYILKQTKPFALVDAILEVMQGGAPMTPIIARKVLQLFNKQTPSPTTNSFNLTTREIEVLQWLARGYSYKMIAAECNVSYPTINSHISSIYSKLKVESVGGAVYKAIKEGLVK